MYDDLIMADDLCPSVQAFLADQGWEFDAFICHTGADKHFVQILYHEMQKCGLKAFFDKESLERGDTVQVTIAYAIIKAPFCVIILSGSFQNQAYPEAEAKAALAFSNEHKRIIPVFYRMTADDCHKLTRKMYQKLANITGHEKKNRPDEDFANLISQDLKRSAEKQLHLSTSKAGFFVF